MDLLLRRLRQIGCSELQCDFRTVIIEIVSIHLVLKNIIELDGTISTQCFFRYWEEYGCLWE